MESACLAYSRVYYENMCDVGVQQGWCSRKGVFIKSGLKHLSCIVARPSPGGIYN